MIPDRISARSPGPARSPGSDQPRAGRPGHHRGTGV